MSDNKKFVIRLKAVIVVLAGVLGLVVLRLVDLQVWQTGFFTILSQGNREFTRNQAFVRGAILDRYGQLVAANQAQYFHLDDPHQLFGLERELDFSQALPLLATQSGQVITRNTRIYPFENSLAQVVGYVQLPNKDDLLSGQKLIINEVLGKAGLEARFEKELRGIQGKVTYQVDSLGQIVRQLRQLASEPGQNLKTTVDPYLSEVALQAMGEKKGAVVILDGQTGSVLTLISTPSYNPNVITNPGIDAQQREEFKRQLTDTMTMPDQPFFNRAIAGVYPPGSVFKLVTALTALESGKFNANTIVRDEGVLRVGEYSYANWYFTQYGRVDGEINLRRAIARSNDIFFYKAAEGVGPDALAELASRFGFGKATGIEVGGENTGLVPNPDWKLRQSGESWYLGNTYHFGIGQGDLLTTPLQVAQMTQAVVNQGVICSPHLIEASSARCESLGLDKDNLSLVVDGMMDVCSVGGTAFPFFEHNGKYRQIDQLSQDQLNNGVVACKTGTAEWGGKNEQGFLQTHGWFTMAIGLPDDLINNAIIDVDQTNGEVVDQVRLQPTTPEKKFSDWTKQELYSAWRSQVTTHKNFPRLLVITVLVESDAAKPYAEGSADAAPVAKTIVDWLLNK